MPYTNDMQTMAQLISPVDAAVQMGIQNQQANEAQGIQNLVAAGQAPAKIQQPGLQNLFTQAQTAASDASTQGKTLENIGTAGTLGSTINVTNAGNQLKITQDQAQKLQTLGQMAGQIAGYMDNIPEPARPAMMQQIAQQYGLNLSQMPGVADGNPDTLRTVSQKMIQMSAPYQTEMAKLESQGNTARDVATIQGNSRVTAAETTAQARLAVAQVQRQMHEQQQTAEQAAIAAAKRGDTASYKAYAQLAQNLKQAQAGITSQLVTGQNIPVPDLPQGGPTNVEPASAGGAGAAPNAVEAEMRRRGLLK